MSRTIVSFYGVHWSEGVAYLHQHSDPNKSAPNMLGLKQKSPFHVIPRSPNLHCTHVFPMTAPKVFHTHWDQFLRLAGDPLVQAMLPVPKSDSGFYHVDVDNLYLIILSKMSNPTTSVVRPIWTMQKSQIISELALTNVQPLVLTGVEEKHHDLVHSVLDRIDDLPRRLILVGSDDIGLERTKSQFLDNSLNDLVFLPWELIGANVLRYYMRNELNI